MTGTSCLIERLWGRICCIVNQTSCWASMSMVCLDEASTVTGSQRSKLPSRTYEAGKQTSWLASSQQQTLSWNTQIHKHRQVTSLIAKNTYVFPFFVLYINGWVLMEGKTESVKNISCLPSQSLQTLFVHLYFFWPPLSLSFFALRDETDTQTQTHKWQTHDSNGDLLSCGH